ncbi:MAG: SAM-dependent methyltransferase [Firmicutes bacterium]|nr:SAM-dependent methyltransferase [Dethiobacter sp.]MBS3887867.1 SAM-dependent methyltransferase [Bacillota bacterium]MBS4053722.1 SAM-dependent methyltransferase [Thermaerobacter sp.]
MDKRLLAPLGVVGEKMQGRDFQFLQVETDGRRVEISPLWGRAGFVVQTKGESTYEVPLEDITMWLEQHIGAAKKVLLRCVLRSTETLVTLESGKIKVHTKAAEHLRSDAGAPPSAHSQAVITGTRQDFIKAEPARKMLTALGIMSPTGEIKGDKRRKFYQVDRFIELLSHMVADWPRGEELVVLDCGCGKSYLSFALNYYLHEVLGIKCFFIGIDQNQDVVDASRRIQEELIYRNMEFVRAEVSNYVPSKKPHLVLSLHACDTATDEALALGLAMQAKYIIAVPCCQAALTESIDYGALQSLARHALLKQRLADVLTDGLRVLALEAAGYKVSVVEYVSPLDTPKNLMIRAERSQTTPSARAYDELKRVLKVEPWIDRLSR